VHLGELLVHLAEVMSIDLSEPLVHLGEALIHLGELLVHPGELAVDVGEPPGQEVHQVATIAVGHRLYPAQGQRPFKCADGRRHTHLV
jgi:hypothetical protein